MPEVLFFSCSRLAGGTLQRQKAVCNEVCCCRVSQPRDMDFFVDEGFVSTVDAEAAVRSSSTEKGTIMFFSGGATQPSCSSEYMKGLTAADCDVYLPLFNVDCSGRKRSCVTRVTAAVTLPDLSTPAASRFFCEQLTRNNKNMEEKVAIDRGGAAWPERFGFSMPHEESGDEGDDVEKAAGAAAILCRNNFSTAQDSLRIKKKLFTTGSFENSLCQCNFANVESGKGSVMVYRMQLPTDFVLGLRLPSLVEKALVEHYLGERAELPTPPPWLSSFLYTKALRHSSFGVNSSLFFSASRKGLVDESTAMTALEALCIVALRVIAQIGFIRQKQIEGDSSIGETLLAQNILLHYGGLFSLFQEKRMKCWLQDYMPLGMYSKEEEEENFFCRQSGWFSWPSAVTIVFHLALELTEVLFPSLLMNLESVILLALQPLLEAGPMNSALMSPFSFSLRLPRSRKQALTLLTQGPIGLWKWWEEKDSSDGKRGGHYISAISTSRGYAALRVLYCFTSISLSPSNGNLDVAVHDVGKTEIEEEEEYCEILQFLLSAPVLFAKLLLDRDVITALGHATKNISNFYHSDNKGRACRVELVAARMPQAKRVLVRCFLVLLCWLAFRPGGYSRLLAQKQFGAFLLVAALPHEQQHQLGEEGEYKWVRASCGEKEHLHSLLAACSSEYLSVIFLLLTHLRNLLRTQKCGGNNSSKSRVNPWKLLSHGGISGNFFLKDDDRTTNTSRSHRSVGSYHSTTGAGESDILARPCFFSDDVMTADTDVFSSRSSRFIRRVIRKVCSVLSLLRQDIFMEQSTPALDHVGSKRQRDEKDNTVLLPEGQKYEAQFAVSPQLAYQFYSGRDSGLWEWHLEGDSYSDNDTTDASASGGN